VWDLQNLYFPGRVIFSVINEAEDVGCANIPTAVYQYSSDPQLNQFNVGCQVKNPISAADYISEVLKLVYPKASDLRMLDVQKPRELAEHFEKNIVPGFNERLRIQVSQMDPGTRGEGVTYDVARVKFSYVYEGIRYEGHAQTGTLYLTFGWPTTFGGYTRSVEWWTDNVLITAARAGQYDAHKDEFAMILGNSRTDPVWVNLVAQYGLQLRQMKNEQIRIEGEAIRRSFQRDLQSMNRQEVIANANQSNSNVLEGWGDAITGVDRWRGGDGDTYSAPTGYDYMWQNSNGDMVPTNDSTFNPNYSSDYSGDWTQMEQVPWSGYRD
jgi:hypothetical protein